MLGLGLKMPSDDTKFLCVGKFSLSVLNLLVKKCDKSGKCLASISVIISTYAILVDGQ